MTRICERLFTTEQGARGHGTHAHERDDTTERSGAGHQSQIDVQAQSRDDTNRREPAHDTAKQTGGPLAAVPLAPSHRHGTLAVLGPPPRSCCSTTRSSTLWSGRAGRRPQRWQPGQWQPGPGFSVTCSIGRCGTRSCLARAAECATAARPSGQHDLRR